MQLWKVSRDARCEKLQSEPRPLGKWLVWPKARRSCLAAAQCIRTGHTYTSILQQQRGSRTKAYGTIGESAAEQAAEVDEPPNAAPGAEAPKVK